MVSFATDPGTDVFLRGLDAGERARKARQTIAVDTAVRRGLAASMGMSPPDAVGAPALAPAPAADGAAPAAAPPPQPALAPAPQGAPQAAPQGGPVASPPPSPAPAPAPAPRPALAPAAAMPGAQPVGDRYEPVLRELAQVEGGGAAALGVLQQQDRSAAVAGRRQDQLARLAMYALSKGDVATGQYFASQAGIPLPNIQPGRGRGGAGGAAGAGGASVQQARLLGTATLAARRLYGNDVGQAQRFTQAYIQNGGDIAKAIEAAGDPTQGPIRQWRWRQNPQTQQEELVGLRADGSLVPAADDDGQPFVRAPQQRVVPTPSGYAAVDPQAGTARPVTQPDGTQLPAPQRGGAAGAGGPRANARPLDREVKRDMLIAAGVSPTEAALIAAGGTLSPSAAAAIRQRIIAAVDADYTLKGDTPDKIAARQNAVERQFRQVVDALSPVRQGGGGPAAGTPAPSLPPARSEAAPLAPAPATPAAPAPQAAATAAPPAPPRDPAQRQPGNVYTTPRGPMRWTGTGWVQP